MPDASNPRRSRGRSETLNRAFRLARLLGHSPEDAERLLSAASLPAPGVGTDIDPGRESVNIQLLKSVVRSARPGVGSEFSDSLDRDQAQRILAHHFPTAFASLTVDDRAVLFLDVVEGLSHAQMAAVLDISDQEAAIATGEARRRVHDAVLRAASRDERQIMSRGLPDSWLRPALDVMMERLPGAPERLRRKVASALSGLETAPPPQGAAGRRPRSPGRWTPRRVAGATLLVLAVGVTGYVAALISEIGTPGDLLSITESAAAHSDPQLVSGSSPEAQEFLYAQIGRRIQIPEVANAQLQGAGIVRIETGDRVPVLYYEDAERSDRIEVVVFDYELIDRLEESVTLPPRLLDMLQSENAVHVTDGARTLAAAWRHRSDIYVATGSGDAIESLPPRLSFPEED